MPSWGADLSTMKIPTRNKTERREIAPPTPCASLLEANITQNGRPEGHPLMETITGPPPWTLVSLVQWVGRI
jgi:hypothetical protein